MDVTIRPLGDADVEAVVALWRDAGLTRPWNDPHEDIRRARATWPDLLLVAQVAGAHPGAAGRAPEAAVVGSVLAGYDGHRGWLYYLATATAHRGRGVGRALVQAAEERLVALGCPKVMLMVREDNADLLGYYDGLGYARESTALAGRRLIPDP